MHPIRAEQVEIEGTISGQIIATRKVIIHKTGRLTGTVSALGFSVEKGGCFFGELSIGKTEMIQGEKADQTPDPSIAIGFNVPDGHCEAR